ncbi:RNA polymerase sigma factor [Lentibacillus sediminis]|uniref:RNA polymerase sigma factor n=1 Tax=Lentibacillus sediminis TaxID=1940529 RepID=UPI001EFD64A4|nr:RNA polymerase sigma factor [Lentibacillus sediminis]
MPSEDTVQKYIIEWYDMYSMAIYKYIVKMLNDVQQAEDITQETFIRAYKYMKNERSVNNPKTFLYRTAHNLTVDHIRKHSPIQLFKDVFFEREDSRASIELIVEGREESEHVFEDLLSLKTTYRQVIILRKVEGFSIKETASILRWSESKVKSTLFRGLGKLESRLSEEGVYDKTGRKEF